MNEIDGGARATHPARSGGDESADVAPPGEPDSRLTQAIELFNDREFFACHDRLEDLWGETLGPERQFYQGLIHAAISLFHFGEGNLGGARKMYSSAAAYLEPYRPLYLNLDVDRLLADLQRAFAELLQPHAGYPHGVQLDEQLIPRIHCVPRDP
jgi:uncharacterized protein